jgi:signal transduction histidine kinase/CheY-like chemotaxis protein
MAHLFTAYGKINRPRFDRPGRDVFYARLLSTILVVLIILMAVYFVVREIHEQRLITPDIIILGNIVTLILAYYLLRKGHFTISASITIMVTFIGMTYIGMTSMGIRDAAVITYLVIIIFSALLLGKLAALITTILSIISVWVMIYLENQGQIVYEPWAIELIARDVSFVLITTFVLMVFYENVMNRYIREISESKAEYQKISEQLTGQYREISKMNEELKVAMEKAEESDRLKTAFLANLSHEIRTPMNGIIGFSELVISPEVTDEEKEQYNSIIANSCRQLLGVVNDIIDISKIESGVLEIQPRPLQLNQLMQELFDLHALSARNKKLEFLFIPGLEDNYCQITTDEIKLKQILSNLIGNAIKFTKEGFVKFGYLHKNDKIEFFVVDSGSGIPEKSQKDVFERFVQADGSHTRIHGGTGLGLPIAKAYIEKMKGRIWFQSEEQKGTAFYFTLPFDEKKSQIRSEISVDTEKEKTYAGKVLIVEDVEYNEILLKGMLRKYDLELLVARNGKDALTIFKSHSDFNLVFMDIKLPDIDGYEVTREIRKVNTSMPIIAQTAYAFSEDREKAIEAGCNDLISKPITQKALDKLLSGYLN